MMFPLECDLLSTKRSTQNKHAHCYFLKSEFSTHIYGNCIYRHHIKYIISILCDSLVFVCICMYIYLCVVTVVTLAYTKRGSNKHSEYLSTKWNFAHILCFTCRLACTIDPARLVGISAIEFDTHRKCIMSSHGAANERKTMKSSECRHKCKHLFENIPVVALSENRKCFLRPRFIDVFKS